MTTPPSTETGLTVTGIERRFGAHPILRGVSLHAAPGEIVCLLGPSGCGKTTLLRIIAGLETADAGDVRMDGASVLHVPVHARGFGLMFQDFALLPHLNVEDNIAFGLLMARWPANARRARVGDLLATVGLSGFERRDVASLSGGERQRVALARTLAPRPRLLMLDEPLASLDAALRETLVSELRATLRGAAGGGAPALYVTHDQREAFALADRIVLMNAGVVEQAAAPTLLYQRPRTVFAAHFLGLENVFPVTGWDGYTAETALGRFAMPAETRPAALLLHPDRLRLGGVPGALAVLNARVSECVFAGERWRIRAEAAPGASLRLFHPADAERVPAVGETVQVSILAGAVVGLEGA